MAMRFYPETQTILNTKYLQYGLVKKVITVLNKSIAITVNDMFYFSLNYTTNLFVIIYIYHI